MSALARLQTEFPLPTGWSAPELYQEEFRLGDFSLALVGLSSTRNTGEEVTGSTAAHEEDIDRAYFELLERCELIEAFRRVDTSFPLLGQGGERSERTLPYAEVFPADAAKGEWKNAKSNGVAIHRDFARASRAALLELVERDRVLRSWFGEIKPAPIPPLTSANAENLRSFELWSYSFPAPGESIEVAGTFGFPLVPHMPVIFGFGAAENLPDAQNASLREMFQRLGFVYDETFAFAQPSFAPSADFHLEWFLREQSRGELSRWLAGAHALAVGGGSVKHPALGEPVFVELANAPGKFSLVKAIQPGRLPLRFGHGYADLFPHFPTRLATHPIS